MSRAMELLTTMTIAVLAVFVVFTVTMMCGNGGVCRCGGVGRSSNIGSCAFKSMISKNLTIKWQWMVMEV
jgi:hypothetical protein